MIDVLCKLLLIIGGIALCILLLICIAAILINVYDDWEEIINHFRK
jgi:hypothetical protein